MNDAAAGIAGFFLIFMLIEWAIVIIACMIVGKEKNRNGFLWGFFLNLIGLIVIAILPPLESNQIVKEKKPPIKIGWFVLYFLMILFGGGAILTLVLHSVLGSSASKFVATILLIPAVYFASKLSRK